VPVRQAYVTVEDLDFSDCRTTAGDLNERDLERVMAGANSDELGEGKRVEELTEEELEARRRRETMLHKVVDPTLREAQGRPTIVFGVTRQHAAELAMMFRRYGVRAEAVVMDTPLDERAEIIRQFKAGSLQVLCGVGVFTEGFDAPNAAVIVVARPTKSRALYTQMVGRGTRPLPAALEKRQTPEDRRDGIAYSPKPVVTVLDFVGASGRHKLVTTIDILGDAVPQDLRDAVAAKMRQATTVFDPLEEFAREEQQRETMRQAREREEQERREALLKRQREIAERIERERQNRERARAHYTTQEVDPFGTEAPVQRTLEQSTRGSITDKQLEYLKKLGIPEGTAWRYSRQQAGAVIDQRQRMQGSQYRITFGKHAGKALGEVPMDYVVWLANTITDRDRKAAFQAHVDLMITERELNRGNRR
jgi:superfamily II DNA or RNA helicase